MTAEGDGDGEDGIKKQTEGKECLPLRRMAPANLHQEGMCGRRKAQERRVQWKETPIRTKAEVLHHLDLDVVKLAW
jgi:hypothetical protein